jgi:two-component system chemotaxis response regulator CheY
MGFAVHAEANGVSGLARIARERPRGSVLGVIVELEMPVLGGMAILQELRDRYPDIPVLAMSHPEGISRLRQAVTLGAKEYLVKPFDSELFRRKCMEVFQPGRGVT